ncbi:MAG: Ribosome recycling factor [uncultured Chloroflexia bacterium]|uniref:Ribosome-recycling factor n=1 Tax=uncultured Chloroflexia bacterium TaxID=1672391 RepID=A0A6J4ILL2_9CHLR|nr:MAG: Ribosome recycling factor [uncultured Chloroflexia bacterium]
MVKDTLAQAETKMKKSVEALRHHLSSIRTGRASPALVEHLHVEYYGSEVPLNQIANISTPEARMLVIQPWDQGAVKAIEKAIQHSELGINPTNDGRVIRLAIPALTEQRRKELTKLVRKEVEESKVALRNLRRDGQTDLKKLESDKQISTDDLKRAQEKLQELTDRYIKEMDSIGTAKEAEVMEV